MDLNIVLLAGCLAAVPELRQFESGARLARLLVTVRSEGGSRRTDVVPVNVWDPEDRLAELTRGDRVWVTGAVQRRFWNETAGRQSRVEVIAHHVEEAPTIPAE